MPRKKIELGDRPPRRGKAGYEEVSRPVVIIPRPLSLDERVDEGVSKRVVVVYGQIPLRLTASVPSLTSKKVVKKLPKKATNKRNLNRG